MESMLKKVTIILIVLFGLAGCLDKPRPRSGDFNAVVLDLLTNEPVPGTEIWIGEKKDVTNLKGQISLAGLPPGDYQAQMSRDWYESKTLTYKHLGKPALVSFFQKPASLPGRIYYSYDEGQNKDIYELILSDRTIYRAISLLGSGETNPACSAAGKLALESTTDKVSEILLYGISEGNPKLLLSFKGEHPSIDNDGMKMAFKSNGNIIKFDLDDNIQKPYAQAGYNPVISPNGRMVAYASGNYTKLYIDIEDSGFYEFIPGDDYKLNNPCWSPDGEKIAFEAYTDSDGQRAIYYITVDSLKLGMKQITFPSGGKEQHKHPTWGEDNIIYFSGNIIYSSRSDIYAVRVDDGSKWVMVSKGSGNKLYPCWGK